MPWSWCCCLRQVLRVDIVRVNECMRVLCLGLFSTPVYDTGGNVVAEAFSASTGAVPASIPFAPLWAMLLWWLPLNDLGRTYDHLREIRRHLSLRHGLEVEETVLMRGRLLETAVEVHKNQPQ